MRIIRKTDTHVISVNGNGTHQSIPLDELSEYIQLLEATEGMPSGHVDGRRGACMAAEYLLDENIRGFAHRIRWADIRGTTIDYDDTDVSVSVHANNYSLPSWITEDDVVSKEIVPEVSVGEINQHLNTFIPVLANENEHRLARALLARFQDRATVYFKDHLLCIRQGGFSASLYTRKK